MKRYRKRKRKTGIALLIALLLVFALLAGWAGFSWTDGNHLGQAQNLAQNEENERPWYLILVNKDHPIPDGYEVNLLELSNGEQVDERIYPDLQAMFDSARAEGIYPFVAAGYRTHERQQELLEEKITAYENEGNSRSEAEKLAKAWVAVPGTSEHELGISVDINADTQRCSSDAMYQWLAQHAWEYGFIYRYPQDKTQITGIINEPWHYRYVGKEAAKEINEKGICLEEYLSDEE